MSSAPSENRTRKDRGGRFPWSRVLLLLALTWLAVMAGIYWIIKTATW